MPASRPAYLDDDGMVRVGMVEGGALSALTRDAAAVSLFFGILFDRMTEYLTNLIL